MAPVDHDKIGFFLRASVFPVIARIKDKPWLALTLADFKSVVAKNADCGEKTCDVIDYRWEGWMFYFNERVLSPFCLKKSYTKKEFLALCGVTQEQLDHMDVNRYSKQRIFDDVIKNSIKKLKADGQEKS
jgi:hypothetical protein